MALRHELKYYISRGEYTLLSQRLGRTMDRDRNTRRIEGYHIRSLYFDDPDNSAFMEKIDGVEDRDKVRLRIYDLSDRVIKLECKHKAGPYIDKSSVTLSRKECDMLLCGRPEFLLGRREPFAKKMFVDFRTKQLRPRVIVDYVREAYVFPAENVRVTFDKDVRTGFRSVDLFNQRLLTYPALGEYDMILEVKFDRWLPTYIRELIQCTAQRSAISKYCICRKFEV